MSRGADRRRTFARKRVAMVDRSGSLGVSWEPRQCFPARWKIEESKSADRGRVFDAGRTHQRRCHLGPNRIKSERRDILIYHDLWNFGYAKNATQARILKYLAACRRVKRGQNTYLRKLNNSRMHNWSSGRQNKAFRMSENFIRRSWSSKSSSSSKLLSGSQCLLSR